MLFFNLHFHYIYIDSIVNNIYPLIYQIEPITNILVENILNNLIKETNVDFNSLESVVYQNLHNSIRLHSDDTNLLVDHVAAVCFMVDKQKNRTVTFQKIDESGLPGYPKLQLFVGHTDRYHLYTIL